MLKVPCTHALHVGMHVVPVIIFSSSLFCGRAAGGHERLSLSRPASAVSQQQPGSSSSQSSSAEGRQAARAQSDCNGKPGGSYLGNKSTLSSGACLAGCPVYCRPVCTDFSSPQWSFVTLERRRHRDLLSLMLSRRISLRHLMTGFCQKCHLLYIHITSHATPASSCVLFRKVLTGSRVVSNAAYLRPGQLSCGRTDERPWSATRRVGETHQADGKSASF